MPLIHFETLGCRLNQDETEGAAHRFSEAGFSIDVENLTAASPVQDSCVLGIINTCTVTGKAEQKARRRQHYWIISRRIFLPLLMNPMKLYPR